MTGRSIEYVFPPRAEIRSTAPVVLEVDDLSRPREFAGISFAVRAGEILGLAGLVGSGRSEVLETVYGARRAATGVVRVDGKVLRPRSGAGRREGRSRAGAGGAQEPGAAARRGGLQEHHGLDHAAVRQRRIPRTATPSGRPPRSSTKALDVRPAGVEQPVRNLSGGNQQKVVLARWLLRDCRVLLLDEPTRGVDVGARSEIYALIRKLAANGVAIVLVSSEVEEVLGLADRVVVMREGRAVHTGPAQDIDEHQVLDLVMEGSAV